MALADGVISKCLEERTRMLHKITADQFESPAFAAKNTLQNGRTIHFPKLERLFVEFCDDNFRM